MPVMPAVVESGPRSLKWHAANRPRSQPFVCAKKCGRFYIRPLKCVQGACYANRRDSAILGEPRLEYKVNQLPLDFSGEVRLFPLPNLVFYPGCIQPLHIFESRYCEMLEDAMRDDRLLAIATLLPGFEKDYYSRPPIAPYTCLGHVITHEKTDEGTYNLILVGNSRARIKHEITPVRSFRRAAVEIIQNHAVTDSDLARQLGETLARRFVAAAKSADELVSHFREGKLSLSSLTDVVAFHLPVALDLKLKLLKEPDPVQRAKWLLAAFNGSSDSDDTETDRRAGASDEPDSSPRLKFPPEFGIN